MRIHDPAMKQPTAIMHDCNLAGKQSGDEKELGVIKMDIYFIKMCLNLR